MQNIKDYLKIYKKTLTLPDITDESTKMPPSFKSRHYRPSVMVDYGGKALCALCQ